MIDGQPGVRLIAEGPNHLETLADIATNARIAGSGVHDARIAAICLQHGVSELVER